MGARNKEEMRERERERDRAGVRKRAAKSRGKKRSWDIQVLMTRHRAPAREEQRNEEEE